MSESCTIIIPLYNESDGVEDLISRWGKVISELKDNISLVIYNDGSKDNSAEVLKSYLNERPWLKLINKENQGHGPSIIRGYRDHVSSTWIFQADSDNEIPPERFIDFWKAREQYDFLIGKRQNRTDGRARKVLSFLAKSIISFFFGNKVSDVNCPFRLMRVDKFREFFLTIPPDTFAPNVIMSGYASKKDLNIKTIDVEFEERQFGESTLDPAKLIKLGFKCAFQTLFYRIFHY